MSQLLQQQGRRMLKGWLSRWPLPLGLQTVDLPFRLLYLQDRSKTNFMKACTWPKCCVDWGERKSDVVNGRNRSPFGLDSTAVTFFFFILAPLGEFPFA